VKDKILGVNQVCCLLNISKKAYYHSTSPEITLDNKYKNLKSIIIKIIQDNPAYGYPRIKKVLENEYKEVINHKLLLKLLKIWRLSLPRKVKKRKRNWLHNILDYLGHKSNLLRTLLLNGIEIECFKVILSDFTEINYSCGKVYLCVHMDYVGKYIFGYEVSLKSDQEFVISSGKKALRCLRRFKVTDFSKIIFHQDRGSVYTSEGYVTLLLKNKIQISYSRKGEPGDNAVNESFFSRLKDEWKDVFYELKEISEVKKEIKKVIEYYNKKRYHSSIGYKTPLAYILDQRHI
jgi:transposase InsO family protein